jgi:cytochrome c oxidase assembly protein subunit 11
MSDLDKSDPDVNASNGASKLARSHRRVATTVAGVSLLMLGLSFAAVPLYAMFCAATGYGGTPRVAEAASATRGERTLTVRFDSNVGGGIDWSFEPEIGSMRLRTGDTATVFYKATNHSKRPASRPIMSPPIRSVPISTRFPVSASPSRRSGRAKPWNYRSSSFSIRRLKKNSR